MIQDFITPDFLNIKYLLFQDIWMKYFVEKVWYDKIKLATKGINLMFCNVFILEQYTKSLSILSS